MENSIGLVVSNISTNKPKNFTTLYNRAAKNRGVDLQLQLIYRGNGDLLQLPIINLKTAV